MTFQFEPDRLWGMENVPIDSEKYLEKIKGVDFEIPFAEIEGSLSRLGEPFSSISTTENGIDIIYEGIKISIEYKSYTYVKDGEKYTSDALKEIDKFAIKTEDKEFDLFSILPPGTRVIFQSGSEKSTGSIINIDGVDEISIAGEINSPKMVAVLLHEVGHIIDMEKIKELGLKGYEAEVIGLMDNKENADIAEEIRKERIANAFALKVLRPFLRNPEIRKDMLNLLKYDALASYYYSARKQLKDRSQRSSHTQYVSMDVEDFTGDEW